MKIKNDTLEFDVRRIEEIRYSSPSITLNYSLAVVSADITLLFLAEGILFNKNFTLATGYGELYSTIIFGAITYGIIRVGYIKLDTKTKWSFY